MEATKLHTDLEWEQNGMNGIHTQQGQCIATTFGENRKENALFICKAVNSHHKLVEALEYGIKHISRSINATPSGELRNEMTDWNIVAQHLLQSLK